MRKLLLFTFLFSPPLGCDDPDELTCEDAADLGAEDAAALGCAIEDRGFEVPNYQARPLPPDPYCKEYPLQQWKCTPPHQAKPFPPNPPSYCEEYPEQPWKCFPPHQGSP